MNDKPTNSVHWSFWLIAGVALVWNVMGVVNFFAQMNADVLATYSETARVIVENTPVWASAAFFIAVFSASIGCILLLLRKSAAYYFFITSLMAMITQMASHLGLLISSNSIRPIEILLYILMPLAVAVFLIFYTKNVQRRGWVR